jgi:hypothetical protein
MTLEQEEAVLQRLRSLARLLDSSLRLPGTQFRFGLDPLLGLIPVAGDFASMGLSSYLVWEARRLGLPRHVMIRMMGNVAMDTVVGAIPLLGDAFDFFFRANRRNMRLLEKSLARRAQKHAKHGGPPPR